MPNPKRGTVHIEPPLAGVLRKRGFEKQGPYSSIHSVNILPFDATDNREVSATRPPLEPFESVTDDVNLLVRVSGDGNQTPQQTFLYASEGSLYAWNGGGFDQVDQAFSPPTVPLVSIGRPVYATPFLKTVIIANNGPPLIYDHTDQILVNKLTYLTPSDPAFPVPQDCRIVATWQGAVWFAGAPDSPHILYASRTGDPTDYNYSALPEDEGGAFATIGDNEGLIGEPITALMPQTTDTMVVGCIDSMWAIKGHPRRGGSVESISSKIGPLGNGAWTKSPNNTLYVLTKSGVVTIGPQDGAIPALISKEKVPNDIIGLDFDTVNPTVSMAYDTVWNGLIINVRGDQEQSWWFDPKYGGFHQMQFDSYPAVMLGFPELDSSTSSGTLFGGEDGLFHFDINGTAEIPSYNVLIGPIKISPNAAFKSKVETVKAIFGLHSVMDGTFTLWVGNDGEEAYNNAFYARTGTGYAEDLMTLALNNGYCRPQLSGHAAIVELEGDDRIIFESADFDFIEAGRMRGKRNWSVPPRVEAGPDQRIEQLSPSSSAQLNGKVDAIVPVTNTWTVSVGNSAEVTFTPNSHTIDAIAVITAAGTYTLRLTSVTGDGLTAFDEVAIVTAVNTAPVANAGPDFTTITNVATRLAGSATYSGFHPPVTYAWTVAAHGGDLSFVDSTAANTNVTFTTNANSPYTLTLTASDSASPPLHTSNDVVVTVANDPGTHYASTIPANPPATLSGAEVEYKVDLSTLDNTWWANMVSATGEDIRVTDGSVNLLPFDAINVDKVGKTGLLIYKRTVTTTGQAVRIYNGVNLPRLDVNDPNGQYNAYRSDCVAFYPDGGGGQLDRTRNQLWVSIVGNPVVTSLGGPIGADCTTYGENQYAFRVLGSAIPQPISLIATYDTVLTGSQEAYPVGMVRTVTGSLSSSNNRIYLRASQTGATQKAGAITANSSGTESTTTATTVAVAGWQPYGGHFDSASSFTVVTAAASSTASPAFTPISGLDCIMIGVKPKLSPTGFSETGNFSLVGIYSSSLSTAHLQYVNQMLDQATFYTPGWVTT